MKPVGKPANRSWIPGILYLLAGCVVPLSCILLAEPFSNGPFADDWSFSKVALTLAQTGRLEYCGWGAPMILFQTLWGSAWIRIFGFSFNVLKIASLPFSLGFVWLVYALGRKMGLAASGALFGALVVGTSPVFVPLAASFMTEPYACFFTMVCLYAAVCASDERAGRGSAEVALWILAVSGIVGGSDRQSVWVAPLALIPYLFWVKRSDRRFSMHAAIAYAVCLISVGFLVQRFAQPYGPLELSRAQLVYLLTNEWRQTLGRVTGLLLCSLLLALPALLCVAPCWRRLGAAGVVLLFSASLAAIVALAFLFGSVSIAPFTGDILSPMGVLFEGEDALGYRAVLLSMKLRLALTALVLFATAAPVFLARKSRDKVSSAPKAVLFIFACAYLPLLLPGALVGNVHDRYLLPIVPVLTLLVLARFLPAMRGVPPVAWACLCIFAVYSVATTHDYASSLRARFLVAKRLEDSGIPRGRISAGVEYDGWTQLQMTGKIAPFLYGDRIDANTTDRYWFWAYATAVQPDYVVKYSRGREVSNGLPSLSFATWLPPFRRFVTTSKRSESLNTVVLGKNP